VITYNQKQLRDITFSSSKEWVLADGEGGFSCSTVSFMNTRRQHSLLTVSLNQPLKRLNLLNKVDEEVIIENKSYFLGTNSYPGTAFPEGYKLISKFTFDYFPQVTYELSGCQVTKSILMPKKSSSIFIHYMNLSKKAFTLRLLPLVSFRPKDSVRKFDESFLVDELPDGVRIIADMNLPRLYLKLSQIYSTSPESHWYYNFVYPHDPESYGHDQEDLFNMGYWETELEPGKGLTLAASTRDLGEFDYAEIESHYMEKADKVRSQCGLPKKYSYLANSADNYLVHTGALRTPTVIEGYPYGRIKITETLLALDGITYVLENFDREFMHELVSNEINGSLPANVDEETLQVNYGDPRVSLYFAFALGRRVEKAQSTELVRRYLPLLDSGVEIINSGRHEKATQKDSPLLDFDEMSDDEVSRGVENAFINTLWYNLLELIDKTRLAMGASPSHSEETSRIASAYYGTFFETDGNYKSIRGKTEIDFKMAFPLIVPHSPLNEEQKTRVCRVLVSKFLDFYGNKDAHRSPNHACNLAAIYLLEASRQVKDCEKEFGNMRWYIEKLLALQEFTSCVDGLPKCGSSAFEHSQDVSSSMVTTEAIRLIKKLKLK
jgi:predicted glycogen debranching enzyme